MPGRTDSDGATTRRQIARLSRAPFQDKLAQILDNGPTDEAIVRLAEASPDRWAKLVAVFSRIAGYSDLTQVELSVTHRVAEMSDSELEQALQALTDGHLDTQSNVDMS